MPDTAFDALVPLGWDDRVAALFATVAPVGSRPARVVRVERSACIVTTGDADAVATADPLPAVGDWVAVVADNESGSGPLTVAAVLDRWSALTRRDSMDLTQVLAANVDVVLITAPLDRLRAARVEREVAVAWDSGARPVVLVTKADLAAEGDMTDGGEPAEAAALRDRLVGVDVLTVSTVTGAGLDAVRRLIAGNRTAVMLGPSGAGKSSLVNALVGDAQHALAVGSVRAGDNRGRHTTTSRHLVVVPAGGVLIDTPGIRSLSLAGDGAGMAAAFPDIEELAAACRFSDCHHDSEPGCAVLAAVDANELDPARLANYRKLEGELHFELRRDDPLARQAELRMWKARTKAVRKLPPKR